MVLLFTCGFLCRAWSSSSGQPTLSPPVARTEKGLYEKTPGIPYGRWDKLRTPARGGRRSTAPGQSTPASPYLGAYRKARGERRGTTHHDPDRACNGATLYCSGHKPKVYLVDMAGHVLHSWSTVFRRLWPAPLPFTTHEEHKQFIRRARLFPNGDLLCLFEYVGLFKLDKDSEPIWKFTGLNHHDFDIARDGRIYSLGISPRTIRESYPHLPYQGREDHVIILDPDGMVVKRISIFEAFYRSVFANYLHLISNPDFFHANGIDLIEEPLPEGQDLFRRGDILVSLRNINTIALIDGETDKVKWALTGMWVAQHQPAYLPSGRIMLFDNRGGNRSAYYLLNRSRILEFDPFTQQVAWEYGGREGHPFYSHWLGYCQRLANGNTLITESTQGRIFEVTPGKEVVWEFYNPHRAGERQELIASVMGAVRIDPKELTFLEGNPRSH